MILVEYFDARESLQDRTCETGLKEFLQRRAVKCAQACCAFKRAGYSAVVGCAASRK